MQIMLPALGGDASAMDDVDTGLVFDDGESDGGVPAVGDDASPTPARDRPRRSTIVEFRDVTCGYDGAIALRDVNLHDHARRLRRPRRAERRGQDHAASGHPRRRRHVPGRRPRRWHVRRRSRPRAGYVPQLEDDRLELPGHRRAGRDAWAAPPTGGSRGRRREATKQAYAVMRPSRHRAAREAPDPRALRRPAAARLPGARALQQSDDCSSSTSRRPASTSRRATTCSTCSTN